MRTGFNSELDEEDEDPEEIEEDPEEEDQEELEEEENPKELVEEELAEEDPEEVEPEEEDPEEVDPEEEDPEELEEEEDPEELVEDPEELEEDPEELEEDPEELEEDPEELEEEEDPEEIEEEEEDPEEYASRPCSKRDTSETVHSGLGERNRSGNLTAFGSTVDRLQNKTNRNNQRHSKWDRQPKQEDGNSGRRRRSRWDIQEDYKTGEGSSKKQKTRWATVDDSKFKSLAPLQLPDFKNPKTKDLQARLIEINSKLRGSELQDEKMRQQLMEARHTVLSKMIEIGYRDNVPKKLSKKVYIPVEKFPDYNFIGLILGPRGNTQKRMEKETGALIRLRGKGSGTGSKRNNKLLDTSDKDELHVYIESDEQNSLDKAVAMVEKLLIPFPLENNELKRAQLEELVRLEATCRICKEKGHTAVACPQRQSGFHTAIPNPQNKAPDANDAKLYVGFLPHSITDYRLRELFSPFGKIISASVLMDRNTGLSKGYGFVNFRNPEEAAAAIAHMNQYQIEGHRLAVRVAGRPPGTGPTAVATSPQFPGDPDYVSSSPTFGAQFPGDPDYMGSSSFMHFNHSP